MEVDEAQINTVTRTTNATKAALYDNIAENTLLNIDLDQNHAGYLAKRGKFDCVTRSLLPYQRNRDGCG